jgi:transposase-like protein
MKDTVICPYCSSVMVHKKLPFIYHGRYTGSFDGYSCPLCHRKYFTEKAYKQIMKLPLGD